MTEIATKFHEELQSRDVNTLDCESWRRRTEDVLGKLQRRIPEEVREKMGRAISRDEVLEAIMSSKNEKAPGLDRIPIEVWKMMVKSNKATAQEEESTVDIARCMATVFNDIEENGISEGTRFSEGWMCPIYKKKDRQDITNYRPITVLNTDYKIMTKILTSRLTMAAPSIIHEDQAGFMKGRSIYDQIELLHAVIDRCERENLEGAIVCLDQEKAYDRIRHDFLWQSLRRFGIPEHFIKTVQNLYHKAETRVMINGVLERSFQVIRGVRQGDPLSCLLFNACIESLAELVRKSDMKGLKFAGLEEEVKINLFADDTTVFLSKEDDTTLLFSILEEWCQASGAKFNIDKTVIIPLGAKEYREQVREDRRTSEENDPIPKEIKITQEGEPTRVLGAYYGHSLNQEEIWGLTVEKVRLVLNRWERSRPSLAGRCKAASEIVGSHTQYLARVQGMPKTIEDRITKVMDNFIHNKKGEKKQNTIGVTTLTLPKAEGGLALLDLRARNEAIELMKLKAYMTPEGKRRPTWAKLADSTMAQSVTRKDEKPKHNRYRPNFFLQSWRMNTNKLLETLKRMVKSAEKHNMMTVPNRITHQMKIRMPAWHHKYSIEGPRPKTYNNKWGRCQHGIHSFTTIGDLYNHAVKNEGSEHKNRQNCDCYDCYADRRDGCQNPIACRRNADGKLGLIHINWNPKHRAAKRSWEIDENKPQEEEPPGETQSTNLVRVPRAEINDDPYVHVRVFTSGRKDICIPQVDTRDRPRNETVTTLYTDSSSLENGQEGARAGSGVWYGPEDCRNKAVRLPEPLTTNNAAELAAVLVVIQDNKEVGKLIIKSDSQYTIDAVTTHLAQWLDEGFIRKQNNEILQTIYGEMLHMETEIAFEKVKGHSRVQGNEGADRLADMGARKQEADELDMTQGKFIRDAGAKLQAMSQSILYHGIIERKERPERERTRRNLDLAINLIEENTGKRVGESAVWKSLTKDNTMNRKP
jgi:ribonuclease HI